MNEQWLQHVRGFLHADAARQLGDHELVRAFAQQQDERAFAVLLERHGPMVVGVCRRILGHAADADDAFQATFLVLVKQAPRLTQWGSLANWLYTVAQRVAWKALQQRQRRPARSLNELPEPAVEPSTEGELKQVLDHELAALPAKYRLPVVLCHLQGHSIAEAAGQLGWPVGTVSGRIARAKELLRQRLAKRGITVSVAALAGHLVSDGVPPLHANVLQSIATAGERSAMVTQLAHETLRSMRHQGRLAWVSVVAASMLLGSFVWAWSTNTQTPPEPKPPVTPVVAKLPEGVVARVGSTNLRHAHLTMVLPLPDGKTFISAGADGLVEWDRMTGEVVRRWPTPGETMYEVALSADGKYLAGLGQKLYVWERTGQKSFHVEFGRVDRAHRLAFHATQPIVHLIEEKIIRAWDARTGELVKGKDVAFRLPGVPVHHAATNRAAVLNCNSPTYLIDLNTGEERTILHTPKRHDVGGLAFSGDGRWLAGAIEPTIRLLEVATGKEDRAIPTVFTEPPQLSLSHDGRWLAALGNDAAPKRRLPPSRLALFDTTTQKEVRTFSLAPVGNEDPATPTKIALTPDGKTLLGWDDSTIYMWDATTGERLHRPPTYHPMNEASLSHSGDRMVTSSAKSDYVRVWDATGKQLLAVRGRKPSISPDGSLLLVVVRDGHDLQLWDIATGKQRRTWTPHPDVKVDSGRIGRAFFLPDGQQIMTIGAGGIYAYQGTVAFWNIADGRELRRVGPVGDVLARSHDGKFLLGREPDYSKKYAELWCWDLTRGTFTTATDDLRTVKIVPRDPASLSADGRFIAVVDNTSGQLGIWDFATGKRLHTLIDREAYGSSVVWSPDGTMLASSRTGSDNVQLWDARTGKELRSFRTGQGAWPRLAFSGDSQRLATIGADTTALVWNTRR